MVPPTRHGVFAVAPQLVALVIFALGMALVEAVAVLYLRTLFGTLDPSRPGAAIAPGLPSMWFVEVGREVPTLVMLGAVGWLAGRGTTGRVGAFLVAFGTWDIGYYVFLHALTGSPRSLFDTDILLQFPLPWRGPVVAPALIALLMVAGGSLAIAREAAGRRVRPAGIGSSSRRPTATAPTTRRPCTPECGRARWRR